jgi:hypothetical protein
MFIGFNIEPLWGTKETAKIIFITTLLSSITTFLWLLFVVAIFQTTTMWFEYQINGFAAGIAALSVGMKQLCAEKPIEIGIDLGIRGKVINIYLLIIFLSTSRYSYYFGQLR